MKPAIATAFAAMLCVHAAHAADLRDMLRVPGDWRMTVTGGFIPSTTQNACYRGDKSVGDLTTFGLKNCGQQSIVILGDHATVDAVCSLMNLRVSVHATVTPTGDAAVHSDTHVHLDGKPPMQGIPSDMTLSIDAHRVGPCQPGERGF
jgi:hypothetical protein